mmetsp:Transcript_34434/g.53746  ORF Transcript_34434/g.53746 Transcript_34434/m.53746 type:complete len:237 (+) Transcript_34434:253-963(+)
MDNASRMEMMKTKENLFNVHTRQRLREKTRGGEQLCETARFDKLEDNVEVVGRFDDAIIFYNVRVVQVFEDVDFVFEVLVGGPLNRDSFHSHNLPRLWTRGLKNPTELSLPKLLFHNVLTNHSGAGGMTDTFPCLHKVIFIDAPCPVDVEVVAFMMGETIGGVCALQSREVLGTDSLIGRNRSHRKMLVSTSSSTIPPSFFTLPLILDFIPPCICHPSKKKNTTTQTPKRFTFSPQ